MCSWHKLAAEWTEKQKLLAKKSILLRGNNWWFPALLPFIYWEMLIGVDPFLMRSLWGSSPERVGGSYNAYIYL